VLFEILSGPGLTHEARGLILEFPKLELLSGFWERAGDLRRDLLKKNLKALSLDCLIAQNCMDQKVSLIAADTDFRHFKKFGLRLV
jgi:predicted nucleic acid-binding protein